MEFKVNRNSFLKIMQTVIVITGKEISNQNNPQFKIEANSKDNKIVIICTNNESNFKKEIKVDVIKEGSFCTNAQKFFELISFPVITITVCIILRKLFLFTLNSILFFFNSSFSRLCFLLLYLFLYKYKTYFI